jgi:uncharacterized RDD family membrane protein YckC
MLVETAMNGQSGVGVTMILSLIWTWLYYALFESSNFFATPGKKACGLIVTTIDGHRLSFGRASGRYFGKWISGFTLGIGWFMAGWTRRKQALHDLISDCVVLKKIDQRNIAVVAVPARP